MCKNTMKNESLKNERLAYIDIWYKNKFAPNFSALLQKITVENHHNRSFKNVNIMYTNRFMYI